MKLMIYALVVVYLFAPSAFAGSIASVNPDHATQGDKLWVTITGAGTQFGQGSGTYVWFWQGSSTTIHATAVSVINPVTVNAYMEFPVSTPVGYWNVTVQDFLVDIVTGYDKFLIVQPIACGDFNGSGVVNLADVLYLVQYIFLSGSEPLDPRHGDVNCDNRVTLTDAVYLVGYIFLFGSAPCAGC